MAWFAAVDLPSAPPADSATVVGAATVPLSPVEAAAAAVTVVAGFAVRPEPATVAEALRETLVAVVAPDATPT